MDIGLREFPPLKVSGAQRISNMVNGSSRVRQEVEEAVGKNSGPVSDKKKGEGNISTPLSLADGVFKASQEEDTSKSLESLEPEVKKGGSWRALFPAPRVVTPQKAWQFTSPKSVKGKRVVSVKSTNSDGVNWCDNLVIGFFVGKGLSFSAVKTAVEKLWKLKQEVSIRAFGNGAFIFEFSDNEDRTKVLEMGSFYIASKLFSLRPWSPLIEKSVTDIKSVPIWVCIYGVPLHLWEVEGLGLISSYLGKPLLADECTIKKDRLSYARICIEIDIDFEFPDFIPILVDDEIAFDLPVEYQWRPQKCAKCRVFGHDTKNCARTVKATWIPKVKKVNIGSGKVAGVEQKLEHGTFAEMHETEDVVRVELEDRPGYEISTGAGEPVFAGIHPKAAEKIRPAGASKPDISGTDEENRLRTNSNMGVPSPGNVKVGEAAGSTVMGRKEQVGSKVSVETLEKGREKSSPGINDDWTTVKGKNQIRQSPKKNPFMVFSDFKAESRFPINRKLEDEEFELKFKYLSEEQKMVKKQEREMKRLKWNGNSDFGSESPGRGTRSQLKKK